MEEFVIGFCSDDPEGMTPIDIVSDVTGLTYSEIRSCCETVKIEPSYSLIDLLPPDDYELGN